MINNMINREKQLDVLQMDREQILDQIHIAKSEVANAMRKRRMYESLLKTVDKINSTGKQL